MWGARGSRLWRSSWPKLRHTQGTTAAPAPAPGSGSSSSQHHLHQQQVTSSLWNLAFPSAEKATTALAKASRRDMCWRSTGNALVGLQPQQRVGFPSSSECVQASSTRTMAGLADFFETGRDPNQDANITYGRSWKAEELRQKSWEDLHQLWYVCMKEKNMLLSQKQMLLSQNMRMPNLERFPKVRRTMCRIKQVLTERALAVEDRSKRKLLRKMINNM